MTDDSRFRGTSTLGKLRFRLRALFLFLTTGSVILACITYVGATPWRSSFFTWGISLLQGPNLRASTVSIVYVLLFAGLPFVLLVLSWWVIQFVWCNRPAPQSMWLFVIVLGMTYVSAGLFVLFHIFGAPTDAVRIALATVAYGIIGMLVTAVAGLLECIVWPTQQRWKQVCCATIGIAASAYLLGVTSLALAFFYVESVLRV